jgi:HD-GYP domain-containing protein (c-di-GMP phosphodiesterase class II)
MPPARNVGITVRSSHEHYDGTSYPDGLAGAAIPIEARICSACDAFGAMTTDRSYRKALPVADAVAELHRCAGTQFDPDVLSALVDALHDAPLWPVGNRQAEHDRVSGFVLERRAPLASSAPQPPAT